MGPNRTDQTRWEAVVQRKQETDGAFVYGVLTTGVYCRPGCPSRLPRRENVRFFETAQEAEMAGFRPCKRCSPNEHERRDTNAAAIAQACRTIEEAEEPPSLEALAEGAGLSPFYFHRLFKKIVGVTPKQYALQKRLERVRASLQASSTVTEAAYEAGFASSSRFYQEAPAALGMRPTDYKNGARGLAIRYTIAPSYLGWVLVATTVRGICAIDLGDSPQALQERLQASFPAAELHDEPNLGAWVAKVLSLLQAPRLGLDLPLDIQGTAFQRRVWSALREIPAGTTASYADIAARIGQPKAARAVAQACAANPIAVAIPCHRVVRGDGEMGGYRWGVERKKALLERERES